MLTMHKIQYLLFYFTEILYRDFSTTGFEIMKSGADIGLLCKLIWRNVAGNDFGSIDFREIVRNSTRHNLRDLQVQQILYRRNSSSIVHILPSGWTCYPCSTSLLSVHLSRGKETLSVWVDARNKTAIVSGWAMLRHSRMRPFVMQKLYSS